MLMTVLKYAAALIIFFVCYLISSVIVHAIAWLMNSPEPGIWTYVTPYWVGALAGGVSVVGALSAIDGLFPAVQPRIVVWLFIGLAIFAWGIPLVGLFVDLVGAVNAPLESHFLWSADTPPQLLQSIVAIIAAWILTKPEKET